MNPVVVGNVAIGEGIPKICVPIVEKTKDAICKSALDIKSGKADLIEWRVDWYEEALDIEKVIDTLQALRACVEEIPILFTFRTKREGGGKEITYETYSQLVTAVAKTGLVELIDIEVFFHLNTDSLIATLHELGVKVVGSNHDFAATPSRDELIRRLRRMQEMDADIPKLAVMPQRREDVLTLLNATNEMIEQYADRPIVTMSMGETGLASRLCGELFGSAITFGTSGKASAPGQIEAGELDVILQMIHQSLEKLS